MTNPRERSRLRSRWYQRRIARGLRQASVRFTGLD